MNAKVQGIVDRLRAGERVENREGGNSMVPLIASKQPVVIEPVDTSKLERGDIVYVKVRGNVYTHLVTALRKGEAQIGNNHGRINGWTKLENVYGIVTMIDGRIVSGARAKVKTLFVAAWTCDACGAAVPRGVDRCACGNMHLDVLKARDADRPSSSEILDKMKTLLADAKAAVNIVYTNYRGETRSRRIVPSKIEFMSTPHHPEAQWILHAFDVEKQAQRSFAMKDIREWLRVDTVVNARDVAPA